MKDLITKASNGDQHAVQTLYHMHSDKIYNLALGYMQNIEDAQEVTQDVFIKAFKNLDSFKEQARFDTWLYRIGVNTSLNAIKKRQRNRTYSLAPQDNQKPTFDHPGVLLENKEYAAHLFKVIESLNENQKTAIILSFVEDLPRQKVADIMNMKLKALESLLQRAKKNLKEKIEKVDNNRRI